MSAREAADAFVQHWKDDEPAFGIINFANPDMVGHTGVIQAAVKAVETVDECLGQVVEAVHATGGACIVTADHGNCDEMLEEDGSPDTAHSLNPVPFIVTARRREARRRGHPRRRRAHGARPAGDRAAGGDDRTVAARGRRLRRSTHMGDRSSHDAGTISWSDLATTDQDAAKEFYGGLFGWEYDEQPIDDDTTYSMGEARRPHRGGDLAAAVERVRAGHPAALERLRDGRRRRRDRPARSRRPAAACWRARSTSSTPGRCR